MIYTPGWKELKRVGELGFYLVVVPLLTWMYVINEPKLFSAFHVWAGSNAGKTRKIRRVCKRRVHQHQFALTLTNPLKIKRMFQVLTNGFFSLGTSLQALYRHIIRREKDIGSPRNIDNRDSLYEMFVYNSRCFQEATSSFSRFKQVRCEISFVVFKWFLWKPVYAVIPLTALGLSHPFAREKKHLPR